jgi:beta-aspartyl-dipeptidase (metallo-type)
MIKLLKHVRIYAPAPMGEKDVLIVGEKICRIDDQLPEYETLPDVEVLDGSGKLLVPGYIDLHAHITGGGGEQGPASRVPEASLSAFFKSGVTTVVGLLGTDGITRSLEALVAKARALTEEGMTALALTGSYGYPPVTLTGSVERDIVLVPPMIGVKIAVSDHRSSNPSGEDLIALASAARRAGLLSGTAGLTVLHMGSGKAGLEPVFYALDHSDIPAKNFLPTHMLRTEALMEQGAQLVRRGGYIDCTAGSDPAELEMAADRLWKLLHMEGVSADHVTLSSDAFGSQPRFDDRGNCIGLSYATPIFLHQTIRKLTEKGMPLEQVLPLLTSTPAAVLGLSDRKGRIAPGADADLLLLGDDLELEGVLARGKVALWQGQLRMKGRFE